MWNLGIQEREKNPSRDYYWVSEEIPMEAKFMGKILLWNYEYRMKIENYQEVKLWKDIEQKFGTDKKCF